MTTTITKMIAALLYAVVFINLSVWSVDAQYEWCEQPKVVGRCRAAVERYYFDTATESCTSFTYGGCDGNQNNFDTLENCQAHCESVCDQPKISSRCLAYFPKWFFDKETNSCSDFVYGGCGGNGNNFGTLEKCQSICPIE